MPPHTHHRPAADREYDDEYDEYDKYEECKDSPRGLSVQDALSVQYRQCIPEQIAPWDCLCILRIHRIHRIRHRETGVRGVQAVGGAGENVSYM
jgi:hypothetical protein